MAKLVPSREIIDSDDFQPKLDQAEEKLLAALCRVLDDKWTIYVQPFLNGLHPDFVLFNPDIGIKIIEVKALDYGSYIVEPGGYRTKNHNSGLLPSAFSQVKNYKDALINFEAPWIAEKKALVGDEFYRVVKCCVYFAGYKSGESRNYWARLLEQEKEHYTILGDEHTDHKNGVLLTNTLGARLESKFAPLLHEERFVQSINSALGYPEMGGLSVALFQRLSAEQRKHASSRDEFKHIKGAAGSGRAGASNLSALEHFEHVSVVECAGEALFAQ